MIGTQNVTPLLHQVYLHPELWNEDTVRTQHEGSPHHNCDDILLRFQWMGQFTDPPSTHVVDDPECIWYPAADVLTEALKLIFDLAHAVKAERVGRVIISRLPPGKSITPHEDGGAVASYYTRYQMPLQSAPGCIFECGGEQLQMQDGQVWYFNNKLTHSVINNSNTDRLAIIVDLKTR